MQTLNMEEENINFDSAFKIMSFTMNLNKTHPSIKKDFKWMWQASSLNSTLIFVFCLVIYCTISYDLKDGNITQAYANGIICLIFVIAAYKFFIMLYYQDIIVDIIKKINLDYEKARYFPECEKLIIKKFIKKGQVMTKNWLIVIIITACLFLIKSMGMMIYYTIVDEFKIVHLYEMTYPPAVENIKNTYGMFTLLYFIFLYYDFYLALMYIGFVPLGSVLTLHSCGQLELARSRVLRLFQKENTDDEIIDQIKELAKLLQDILSFIDSIKVSFMIFYELTLKATSLAIPVTLFQIIESMKKGELRVEFVMVFFVSASLSSIPCYYSDMLLEAKVIIHLPLLSLFGVGTISHFVSHSFIKRHLIGGIYFYAFHPYYLIHANNSLIVVNIQGKSLNLAIYTCGWERHWDPRSRKLLLLLFVRTSKSMALRTVFLEICLEALTGVFQMAYTIFNLLNAT